MNAADVHSIAKELPATGSSNFTNIVLQSSFDQGKVKYELRVQIRELPVQIHELRVQIHELED